jgi:anti-sigma factor RsiW
MKEMITPPKQVGVNTNCNDPMMGDKVYDYYNGALEADEVRVFEQHMIQCARCEKVVLELDRIIFSLEEIEREANTPTADRNQVRVQPLRRLRKN